MPGHPGAISNARNLVAGRAGARDLAPSAGLQPTSAGGIGRSKAHDCAHSCSGDGRKRARTHGPKERSLTDLRVAALYDIHGNLRALEAVLAEVAKFAPDRVLVGGDVALGPMPRETLELLSTLGDRVV